MKTIGITGGVGCGKSTVLAQIKDMCPGKCRILLADDIANELKLHGNSLFQPIVDLLGDEILDKHQNPPQIDKNKMAAVIFNPDNRSLLQAVNELIHPAVGEYIKSEMKKCEESGEYGYFFLEAALLLEEKYDEILDEVWYIYSSVSTRRTRLKASRGYTDEKIGNIMSKQLSEEEFKKRCCCVINNDGDIEDTKLSIKSALGL